MLPRSPRPLVLLALGLFTGAVQAQSQDFLLHRHPGAGDGDELGRSLVVTGDLDGDGWADYAVGAPRADGYGRTNSGVVELRSGKDGSLLRRHVGGAAHDWLGSALADLGDVDGDGLADLAVSASNAASHAGQVMALSGADGAVLWTRDGRANLDRFGDRLCAVADLDGDGRRELLVAATGADVNGLQNAGRVLLLSGADGRELRRFEGDGDGDKLGFALAELGDLDGDGATDFALGAPFADRPLANTGTVQIHSGATGALLRRLDGPTEEARFGYSLAGVGDTDGDGLAELLVGAPDSGLAPGSAWLMPGAGGPPVQRFYDGLADGFGQEVAAAGDQDGDGVTDLLVGVPYHDDVANQLASAGRAIVYSGADGRFLWDFVGHGNGDTLGDTLASGDLDGDGTAELLIGSPFADPGGRTHAGEASVWSFRHHPILALSATGVSLSAGGLVEIAMTFPLREADASYSLLMSQSGTGPTRFKGQVVPLTPDPMFWKSRDGQYHPAFLQPEGVLDEAAAGTAWLSVPPGTASHLAGTSLWVCAISRGGGLGVRFVSAAGRIDFLP